jgi:replicative DNA helicase
VAKVADHFKRRLIARSMASLAERAVTDPLPEIAEAFAEVGAKVAQAGNPRMKAATDYARQFEAYLSGRPILPMESCQNLMVCGIPGLDESIVANPGRLIVFGGLPSAGKTALAVQVAVRTVQAGRRVALGSLEMDEDEISARIVACACGVNSLQALRHGVRSVAPEDRGILEGVRKGIVGLHGCAGDSWTSIEAAIAREHRRAPLSLAIVDYLQLLGEPDVKAKRASDTEAQRIGEITKASKRLAQRLGINVLILSQFNRNVAECEEPSLQHFLGSGQIERDIDIAVLLWNTVKNPEPGADRIVMGRIAKNRGGQRYGKVRMRFNPAHNQFTEEAQQTEGGFSAPLVRYTESPLPIGG